MARYITVTVINRHCFTWPTLTTGVIIGIYVSVGGLDLRISESMVNFPNKIIALIISL